MFTTHKSGIINSGSICVFDLSHIIFCNPMYDMQPTAFLSPEEDFPNEILEVTPFPLSGIIPTQGLIRPYESPVLTGGFFTKSYLILNHWFCSSSIFSVLLPVHSICLQFSWWHFSSDDKIFHILNRRKELNEHIWRVSKIC